MRSKRWKLHFSVSVLAIVAMTLALTPAIADPLSGTDEYPDVAFLARNDVPFDAQTAASMAAQLGAPMFITNPNALSDAAADGIADLNPDVLIVAGGVFAISDAVANEAAAACDPDCTVDRRAGAGRDETAAVLAKIAADYGFDRPVLQGSNQVVGDLNIGGTLNVDALTVQDMDVVAGLNADRIDGKHASDFLGATEQAVDAASLDGVDSSELARFGPEGDIFNYLVEMNKGDADVVFAEIGPLTFTAHCEDDAGSTRGRVTYTSSVGPWYEDATEYAANVVREPENSSTSTDSASYDYWYEEIAVPGPGVFIADDGYKHTVFLEHGSDVDCVFAGTFFPHIRGS